MSTGQKKIFEDAEEVIERFGGIRPMSQKTDVPVTTIQGWKKRNTIPLNRHQEILEAAETNNIDLSDLASGNTAANENADKQIEEKKAADIPEQNFTLEDSFEEDLEERSQDRDQQDKDLDQEKEPSFAGELKAKAYAEDNKSRADTADEKENPYQSITLAGPAQNIFEEIERSERNAVQKSVLIAGGFGMIVLAIAALFFIPVKNQVDVHTVRLVEMQDRIGSVESQLNEDENRLGVIQRLLPENMRERVDALQQQAREFEGTIQSLSEKADEISTAVLNADAQALTDRFNELENQLSALVGTEDIQNLLAQLKNVNQDTLTGAQIDAASSELQTILTGLEGRVEQLDEKLVALQNDENSALGQTIQNVSGDDVKAAAMLIAFSQLRTSFNRGTAFEQDLELLYGLVGEENTELKGAIERLAPYADEGVLSPQTLSEEFKGLAGEIAVASLKGEDLSIQERAKARLNDIIQIEKDGRPVNASEEELKIAEAQRLLNEGNVRDAVIILQTLDGEAAQTAQPFIDQAQATLLAQRIEEMISQSVLSNLGSGKTLYNRPGLDLNKIKNTIEQAVPGSMPGQGVVKDEESGVSILPQSQGFKGFSDTRP